MAAKLEQIAFLIQFFACKLTDVARTEKTRFVDAEETRFVKKSHETPSYIIWICEIDFPHSYNTIQFMAESIEYCSIYPFF